MKLRMIAAFLLCSSPLVGQGGQDARMTIGRVQYEGGGDWYANPSSLPNLLSAVRERTNLPVAERERVTHLSSPSLWDVPYLYMTGHGNVLFSAEDLSNLRRFLENGGFTCEKFIDVINRRPENLKENLIALGFLRSDARWDELMPLANDFFNQFGLCTFG